MTDEEIIEGQVLIDQALRQQVAVVDTSFVNALNFKIEQNTVPEYKKGLGKKIINSLFGRLGVKL